MKKMVIFDPAMCCATGVCGPSVDKNLMRVATVLRRLENKGINIERHNLTNNPQIFVDNKVINEMLMKEGIDVLPVTFVDDKVVKTKEYPTNEEFVQWLDIPKEYLMSELQIRKENKAKSTCDCGEEC